MPGEVSYIKPSPGDTVLVSLGYHTFLNIRCALLRGGSRIVRWRREVGEAILHRKLTQKITNVSVGSVSTLLYGICPNFLEHLKVAEFFLKEMSTIFQGDRLFGRRHC